MPFTDGYFVMDNSYYINSDFHNPSYSELRAPPDHIHPNSAAAQLGLTPEELAPILQECENLQSVFAQPPPILTGTTTNHPIPATAQLGLTKDEIEEVLEDQEEWMREEEEQEQRESGHTMAEETHQQQQGRDDDVDARTAPPPLEYTHSTVSHLEMVSS
jgi:hypothetical protein